MLIRWPLRRRRRRVISDSSTCLVCTGKCCPDCGACSRCAGCLCRPAGHEPGFVPLTGDDAAGSRRLRRFLVSVAAAAVACPVIAYLT
jgi:hypothetical protein